MNCQEFNKSIPLFIEKKLEYHQLKDFLQHFNECQECHEELEINFLMDYVLQDEDRSSFNLSEELDTHIREALQRRKHFLVQTVIQWIMFSITNTIAITAIISYILFFML